MSRSLTHLLAATAVACNCPEASRNTHRPVRAYRTSKAREIIGCVEVVDRIYVSALRRSLEPGVFVELKDVPAVDAKIKYHGVIVACGLHTSYITQVMCERFSPAAYVIVVQSLHNDDQWLVAPSQVHVCDWSVVVQPAMSVWQDWCDEAARRLKAAPRRAPPSELHTPSDSDPSVPRTPGNQRKRAAPRSAGKRAAKRGAKSTPKAQDEQSSSSSEDEEEDDDEEEGEDGDGKDGNVEAAKVTPKPAVRRGQTRQGGGRGSNSIA